VSDSGAFDEGADQARGLCRVAEAAGGQQFAPFGIESFPESDGQKTVGVFGRGRTQHALVDFANAGGVLPELA
jgi:hypothetical protein